MSAEGATQSGAMKRTVGARNLPCADLGQQIEGLFYELYGLTDEEIALVDGAS